MERDLRANLRRLGFTASEIAAIDLEEKAQRPPSREPSAAALAQRRYRARKRAEQGWEKVPGWARRRTTP